MTHPLNVSLQFQLYDLHDAAISLTGDGYQYDQICTK